MPTFSRSYVKACQTSDVRMLRTIHGGSILALDLRAYMQWEASTTKSRRP